MKRTLPATDIFRHKLIRFIFVSALNTAFGYGVYFLLMLTTGSIWFSVLLATICGYIFNFFSTGKIVFGSHTLSVFPKYALCAACVFSANTVLLNDLRDLGIDPLVGQVLCLPVVVVMNYVLMAFIVFNRR